jgi:hypothetical protein
LEIHRTNVQTVLTKRRLVMFASRSFLFLAELRPEMLDVRAGVWVGDTQIVLQTVLTKRRLVMFASRSFLFLAELRPEMLDARAGM